MGSPRPSLVELIKERESGKSLPEWVYSTLKRQILTGELWPGERLLEKDLCEALGVSRTPLREALNRLGNEDLVVFRPHCGYVTAPLSVVEFRHLQDLRMIVEGRVAALAAVRATEEDLKRLRGTMEMPELASGDDEAFAAFCRANAQFHLELVRAAHNPMMEGIVMTALDMYQRPAYIGIGRVTDPEKASRCHREIVQALEARDPMKAETVMCSHILGGSERICAALREAGY